MAEYIEREKVLEMLLSADDGNIGSENWRAAIDVATTGLYNMPAVDVQEVKHGKWETEYRQGLSVSSGYVSSCCDMWNERQTDYCPNCGAKMDGEDGGKNG